MGEVTITILDGQEAIREGLPREKSTALVGCAVISHMTNPHIEIKNGILIVGSNYMK
jgi:hypothetical protein